MLKLMIFAPCEKVIIDQDDNTTSLITVLERIRLSIPESEGSNLLVFPFYVCFYALWQSEPDEAGKYEQKVELKLPNEHIAFYHVLPFEVTSSHRNHRTLIRGRGFPVLPAGEYAIKLFLRKTGEENPWEEVAQYPIYVERPS